MRPKELQEKLGITIKSRAGNYTGYKKYGTDRYLFEELAYIGYAEYYKQSPTDKFHHLVLCLWWCIKQQ